MVNGEQLSSQRMIGLPFTVYCLPNAMLYALSQFRDFIDSHVALL
jgi:hypothetical protein